MRQVKLAITRIALPISKDVSLKLLRLLMLATVLCLALSPSWAVVAGLTSVNMTSSPQGTATVDGLVTLTAAAIGGTSVQYKFMSGAYVLRDFNSSNTITFSPSYITRYTLTVVARDLGITAITTVSTVVYLNVKAKLSAVSLKSSPTPLCFKGNDLTLTAKATGGTNVQYKFMISTYVLRDFSSNNTITFAPKYITPYYFTVYARDLNGFNQDATVSSRASTNVKAPLTAVVLTTSPSGSSIFRQPVILTATATGGDNLQYQFMTDTAVISFFSSNRVISVTPLFFKDYDKLKVVVRDINGVNPAATVTSPTVALNVRASLTIIAVNGSVTKLPDRLSYDNDELVKLTAIPNPGYHFVRWGSYITGNVNPSLITMNNNRTVTAYFNNDNGPTAPNPTAPNLGEAGRFVILAGETVTTTGASVVVNGDMGILNEARTYFLTGNFTPGANPGEFTQLTGGLSYAWDDSNTIATAPYATPYPYPDKYATAVIGSPWATTLAMIDQSRTDLTTAYNFLAGANPTASPTTLQNTQLGGQTLTRGVYYTGSGALITEGTLHLDAQGDPNAVWIFTIDGTLTVGAPSGGIDFVGGIGKEKNVYWRTGSDTVIQTGITFFGNVFAQTQINVLSGVNLTGSLFALTDQVTLGDSTITKAP